MLLTTLTLACCLPQGPQTHAELGKAHLHHPATLRQLAASDLDADGDLDLVTVGRRAFTYFVSLWRNDGFAGFADDSARLPAGLDDAGLIRCADLDGDGAQDIVISRIPARNDGLYVLLNGGSTFTLAGRPASGTRVSSFTTADVDGDGDVDLAVCGHDALALWLNDGTGAFAAGARFPSITGRISTTALDADGDGDVDLIAGEILLRNGGGGNFAIDGSAIPADPASVSAAADVDRDGDADLFVQRWSPPGVHVYPNDGSGRFTDAGPIGPTSTTVPNVTVGDFDGDGYPDAILLDRERAALHRNDGRGGFASSTAMSASLHGQSILIAGDLDGDRDLDLAGHADYEPQVMLNLSQGRFTHAVEPPLPALDHQTPGPQVRDAIAADITGDGYPELFCQTWRGYQTIVVNGGDGTFRLSPWIPIAPGSDTVHDVCAADFDGDGDLDIAQAIHGAAPSPNRILLNIGPGFLFPFDRPGAPRLPPTPDRAFSVRAGDFDGQNGPDLVFLLRDAPYVEVLLQGSDGLYAPASSQPILAAEPIGVEVVDFDEDGDDDMWLGDALLENDGSAGFAIATGAFPSLGGAVADIVLIDIDADGDRDAFVARSRGQDLLLEDVGDRFVDVTVGRLPIALGSSSRGRVADLDGDGSEDLIVEGGDQRFLINDGTGVFSVVPPSLPELRWFGSRPWIVAAIDVDLDGDADFIREDLVLRGLRTQLDTPRIPIVGSTWPVDLYALGEPGSIGAVFASVAQASIPIPGIGLLRLDPASLFLAGGVTIGATGKARLDVTVPRSAVLIGRSFAVQALIASPSGRVRLTSSSLETVH